MLQNERYDIILSQLREHGAVKVAELAKSLSISESTVRRDIIELDNMGKLKKVFGGAVSHEGFITVKEADVKTRAAISVAEKHSIAHYAASLVRNDDFVFIDAGTTTERMIDSLPVTNAVFVTNGIAHAMKLMQRGFEVYIPGGRLKRFTQAVVGPETLEGLQRYNFTKCFMGTNGIDLRRGFTTPNMDEAQVKKEAVDRSSAVYILADSTKFGLIAPVTFADLETACIITDKVENKDYINSTQIIETEA